MTITIHPALGAPNLTGVNLAPLRKLGMGGTPPLPSPFPSHTEEQIVFSVNTGIDINPAMSQAQMVSAIQAHRVANGTPATARLAYIDEMYVGGTPDWSVAKQVEAIEAGPLAIPEYTWGAYHLPHTWSQATSTHAPLVAQNDAVLAAIAACGVWMPDFYLNAAVATSPALARASVAYNMSEVRRAMLAAGVIIDGSTTVVPFIWWGITPTSDPVVPMHPRIFRAHIRAIKEEGAANGFAITDAILFSYINNHPAILTGTIPEFNRAIRRWAWPGRGRRRA